MGEASGSVGRQISPVIGAQRHYNGMSPDMRRSLGEQILARRNRGELLHEIVPELGISEPTGRRYMKLALESRLVPTVDEFRAQQNDRLDESQRTISENLEIADRLGRKGIEMDAPALIMQAVEIRTKQIALQLRLDERRARLNGLDAPVKVDATVVTLTPEDAEMEEAIRIAKAKMMETSDAE